MRSLRFDLHFLLLLAFSTFALAPLTAPGYFINAHDARHSVYFLQMFDLSMRDGAWYPRWATNMVFGYGYPLWLILAPLPFFAGEAMHWIGFDFVSAVKLVDGLAFFFSTLAMYLYASRILGKNAGLVAAIAYTYIPYHLTDQYVRAAQAELVAFVFPPLVFWALHRLAVKPGARDLALAAVAYAALILSHIQTAFLFTPVFGTYILFLALTTTREGFRHNAENIGQGQAALRPVPSRYLFVSYALAAIGLALGLAAVFLVPVLFEQRHLTPEPLIGGFFNFRKHFLNANQLLSPLWGYGYAGENGTDQFSLQLGLVPTLLAFVALWALAGTRGALRAHIALFALMVVAIVFLMLPMSAPLWEPLAGVVAYTQFPWRLLSVAAFALAFLSGAAMHALRGDAQDLTHALALVLIFVAASYAYTEPKRTEAVFNYQTQMEFEVKEGELLGDTTWMTGERPKDSPLVAQYVSGEPLQKAIALDEGATVRMIRHGGQSDEVRVEASAPTRVMFYTRYFPGWSATLDDQPVPVEPYGDQGLIVVRAPAGSHSIRLRFQDTPPRQIGTVVSIISLVAALSMLKPRA